MKKTRILLFVAALGLAATPATVFAQPDEAVEDDAKAAEESEGAGSEEEAQPSSGDDDLDALDKELESGDKNAGGLGDICKIDPQACPNVDFEKEAARDIREPLYAVQQIFALRVRRVELTPYWGFTMNDQFVEHPGPGLAANYWITNVLAVGVNGNYFEPFNSEGEFNFQTRRAARLSVPLTDYQWNANLNFTYAPVMGKFSGFGDFIFQYDAYVVGGVGAISTRPIPVVDPDNRDFKFETKLAFNAGLGIHLFFNRWFAGTLEVRDYIFNDQLERTERVVGEESDPKTWMGENSLTNAVQAQVGVSIFLPFGFEYRLPK